MSLVRKESHHLKKDQKVNQVKDSRVNQVKVKKVSLVEKVNLAKVIKVNLEIKESHQLQLVIKVNRA